MQFPCCWNDWSDQQNKRTEILQWFRISWTLCDDPQVKLTAINSQSFHSKYPWLLMTIADYLFGDIRKFFNQGRQTSRFLLTGSWLGWLKCWVNYQSKWKKWRLLEPSYCFNFLKSSHAILLQSWIDVLFNSKVFKKVNKSIVFCSYGGPAGGGGGGGSIMSPIWILKRLVSSLLLRRFVFRMAEASAKQVTGDEPHIFIKRETSGYEAVSCRCL